MQQFGPNSTAACDVLPCWLFPQCGAAILTHGKPEHKLRFAFHVYERDREGYLRCSDLVNAYVAIRNSKRFTIAHADKAVVALTTSMRCKRRDQVLMSLLRFCLCRRIRLRLSMIQ